VKLNHLDQWTAVVPLWRTLLRSVGVCRGRDAACCAWMSRCLLASLRRPHPHRDALQARLAEIGIGTVIHYPARPSL